jgi:hypothetical protein
VCALEGEGDGDGHGSEKRVVLGGRAVVVLRGTMEI